VARFLPTLLVLALLGSTAAAFAVTEGLKLEKSPITRTAVGKVVSPAREAGISFVLRKGDRVSVVIVNGSGTVVRTLASSRPAGKGIQRFRWDGRDDAGNFVADGTYKPRVHLDREHRTIVLPNPMRVDAKPPLIRLVSVAPRVFSPDGDYRRESVRIRWKTSERARAILYVDGVRRGLVRAYARGGKLDWGGRTLDRLPARLYRIRLRGLDLAGNVSAPTKTVVVRIRYVELRPHVAHPRAGTRFGFRVLTDAKRYTWRLGTRGGISRRRVLILRAGAPGRYRLTVTVNGHRATALVIVEPRP
jgi:FlgD Ig-like domain